MSKLYKFRPYLHMDEAAAYLEQLISEEVAEEDIYSLFIMGKINAYIGGNLVGLPVSPPTAETEFDGPWQFITNECLTKCDFFTKALSYPYQVCETSMGQTLLNMVDGVPYAWFKITEGYNPSSGPARNSNNLEPINTDDDLVVLPSDILSIANEANNVSQLPTDKEQADDTVVWFFDEEGKKVTRKPQRLAKSVKVQSPTEQPRVIDSPLYSSCRGSAS